MLWLRHTLRQIALQRMRKDGEKRVFGGQMNSAKCLHTSTPKLTAVMCGSHHCCTTNPTGAKMMYPLPTLSGLILMRYTLIQSLRLHPSLSSQVLVDSRLYGDSMLKNQFPLDWHLPIHAVLLNSISTLGLTPGAQTWLSFYVSPEHITTKLNTSKRLAIHQESIFSQPKMSVCQWKSLKLCPLSKGLKLNTKIYQKFSMQIKL